MYLENIEKGAREFVKGIKDAKILHLRDSEVVHLFNSSVIPVFSNGAKLDRISEKVLKDGSKYEAVRPYLVCYNKALGCKVLYPMTASQTEETIREHKRYHFVEVPEEVYCFIDSAVPGNRFHQETHSEDSMSTVNVERGIPIFAECLDYDDLCIVHDYDNFSFSQRALPVAQSFIKDLYGRYSEATFKAVTNANENVFALIKNSTNEYDHQHYRPAVAYLAMFLNWSDSAVKNNWFSDVSEIERVRSLREITLKAYVDYLRYSKLIYQFRGQNPKAYHEFTEAKTFAKRRDNGAIIQSDVQDFLEHNALLENGAFDQIKDLMRLEATVEEDIAFASKAISMFIQDSKRTIDMSVSSLNINAIRGYKAMAHNQYDPNGLERVNNAFAGVCNSKIKQLEDKKAKIRKEREAELARRNAESKKRQEVVRSRSERVAENVKEALKIYIEHYADVLSECEKGILIRPEYKKVSQEFIRLFTSYDPKYSEVREYIQNSDNNPTQARVSSAILNLSKFVENISDAVEIIDDQISARALQDYFSGESKTVEGENDRQTVNALELMRLVHSEFTRAFKVNGTKKLTNAQMQEVADKLIEKAMRNKDKFSDLDIGKDSRARTVYLDGALEVLDNELYVFQLCAICKLHQEALKFVKAVRFAHISLQMTRNAISGYFKDGFEDAEQMIIGNVGGLEELIAQKEKEIEDILKDRSVDVTETAKRMKEIADRECEICAREQNNLLKIREYLENIKRNKAEYNEYYKEIIESIPKFVKTEKEQRGIGDDFGVFDGHGLVVTVKTAGVDTFSNETTDELTEDKPLTDEELLDTMFIHGLINPAVYSKMLVTKIKSSKSLKELLANLSEVNTKCDVSCDELLQDYTYILKTYGQLLDSVKAIKQHSVDSYEARMKYAENFNPVWDEVVDGKPIPMLSDDAVQRLREVFKLAIKDRAKIDEQMSDNFLEQLVYGILAHIQDIPLRSNNPNEKIEQRFNYDSLVKGSENVEGVSYAVNLKEYKADLETELNVIQSIKPTKLFLEHFDNYYAVSGLSFLSLPLIYELQHEYLLTSIEEGRLNGVYGGDYRRTMLKAMELNKLVAIAYDALKSFGGVDCYDCVYDYLVEALQRAKSLSEYGKVKFLSPGRVSLGNASASHNYEAHYAEWVKRVHMIENGRLQEGRYITTEGRDVIAEKARFTLPNASDFGSYTKIGTLSQIQDILGGKGTIQPPAKATISDVESLKTGDPRIDEVLDEMVAEGFEVNEQFISAFKDATAIIGMLGGGDGSNIADASKFLDSISLKNLFGKHESGEDD